MRKSTKGAALLLLGALGCASKEQTSLKIYVQQKLYDKAITQGTAALAKDPNNGDAHYFMGAAYYGKDGDLKPEAEGYADSSEAYLTKAFAHFTKAKELAPGNWGKSVDDNIVSMFGRHYNRGVIATKKAAHAEAAAEYALARVADPENYQAYYAHAAAILPLASEAKKKDEAEFNRLADAIIADLNKVLELNPTERDVKVSAHQTLGEVLFRRGQMKEAQEQYIKAVDLDPENYELMATIGERFYNAKDWANASKYLEGSIEIQERLNLIDKDDIETYGSLAQAAINQGRRDDAIAVFDKMLKLVEDDPREKAQTLYNILVTHYKAGEAAEKEGNMEVAKESWKRGVDVGNQLVRLDATKPEAWQVLGLCKKGLGDTTGAAQALKKFNDLRTQSAR